MDKKLYIQPQIEITNVVFTQMLADSVTGDGVGSDIDYGGVGNGEGDVKGEAWTDIWE